MDWEYGASLLDFARSEKELLMTKRGMVFLGLLAVALALVLTGCPDSNGGGGGKTDVFAGTWAYNTGNPEQGTFKLVAGSGTFEMRRHVSGQVLVLGKGTYTLDGNTVTATITHINANMASPSNPADWKLWNEATDLQQYVGGTQIMSGTISGDTFTGYGQTFTKE
jgi:hypothetical protein